MMTASQRPEAGAPIAEAATAGEDNFVSCTDPLTMARIGEGRNLGLTPRHAGSAVPGDGGRVIRVVQSVARYFPDPAKVGGIQVNMRQVGVAMQALGVQSTILASLDGSQAAETREYGMRVLRYPVGDAVPVEPNYGPVAHDGFEVFAGWLDALRPDVYHQHQWTPKCGYHHLRFARRLGIPTVVSIHVPLPLCQRKTLMIDGVRPCQGLIDVDACTSCVEHARREPLQAFEPPDPSALGSSAAERQHTLSGFVRDRQLGLRLLEEHSDVILVSADWLKRSLALNGVSPQKILTCKYGISNPAGPWRPSPMRPRPDPAAERVLRIGFFGRWTQMKGPDTVLSALGSVASPEKFEYHMYGIAQEPTYEDHIRRLAAEMPGVYLHQPVTTADLGEHMAQMDVIAVPSRWKETGPLVVMHAFAAGRPVVGSDLGGVAEQVTHGQDGLLLPPNDPAAWARALEELQSSPHLVAALTAGIRRPRSVEDQARETAGVYAELVGSGVVSP
jgi:glycosyltransferase involved in cell wall biosynthesis